MAAGISFPREVVRESNGVATCGDAFARDWQMLRPRLDDSLRHRRASRTSNGFPQRRPLALAWKIDEEAFLVLCVRSFCGVRRR